MRAARVRKALAKDTGIFESSAKKKKKKKKKKKHAPKRFEVASGRVAPERGGVAASCTC
jgi:hypothetical protein